MVSNASEKRNNNAKGLQRRVAVICKGIQIVEPQKNSDIGASRGRIKQKAEGSL